VEMVIDSRADFSAAVVCTDANTTFDPGVFASGALVAAEVGDEDPPHAPSVTAITATTEMPAHEERRAVRFRISPTWSESDHIVNPRIDRTRSGRP